MALKSRTSHSREPLESICRMRDFFITLIGIFMTLYGMISVITPFINPNKQRWMGNTSDFLTEKNIGGRGS